MAPSTSLTPIPHLEPQLDYDFTQPIILSKTNDESA